MRIDVQLDLRGWKARTLREQKHLAYSVSNALNKTTLSIQLAERANLDRKFTIRKAGFMYRLIKIFKFASPTKGVAYTEIGVDSKDRVLLGLFEEGGQRLPVKGQELAVPLTGEPARPSFSVPVTADLTFKAMRLKKQGNIWRGLLGTYLIPSVGVFERVGRGVSKLIYAFLHRPARLKKTLGFEDVAQRVFNEEFDRRFREEYRS